MPAQHLQRSAGASSARSASQGVRTCIISAESGPTMCTPTTASVSACTIIFMSVRSGRPDSVAFIGLNLLTKTLSSPLYFSTASSSDTPTVDSGGCVNTCERGPACQTELPHQAGDSDGTR